MLPERTAQSYGPGVTAASQSVLVELMTVLQAYREAFVLVGGWAPYFLLEQHRRPEDRFVHVGSIDIDLAVDPRRVAEPQYATIAELLAARNYRPARDRRGAAIPTSFERIAASPVTHKPYPIRIDFLTPQSEGDASRSPATIQDALLARKVRGCEAAFEHQERIPVSGVLPDGGRMTVQMPVADVVGTLTMKGIVLGERYREKDAYDIYALAAHYGQGPRDVARIVRPRLEEPLVAEAMRRIRDAFADRSAHGPTWAAAFLVPAVFSSERERLITDAFMVVQEFLAMLAEPQPIS